MQAGYLGIRVQRLGLGPQTLKGFRVRGCYFKGFLVQGLGFTVRLGSGLFSNPRLCNLKGGLQCN